MAALFEINIFNSDVVSLLKTAIIFLQCSRLAAVTVQYYVKSRPDTGSDSDSSLKLVLIVVVL